MNSSNIINLQEKNILINGGFGLIGTSISEKCILSGAKVSIIDNDKKKSSVFKKKYHRYKNNIDIINADSASKLSLKALISKIKKYKNIDTFVNCSYPRDKNWDDNSFDSNNIESFIRNIESNFISNVWLTKEIAQIMKKNRRKSSIVLFSSIYGMVGQDKEIYKNSNIKENICYSVIKGGIINYVKLMASYYAKYQIRINCISPGGVINKKNKLQNKSFLKNYSNRVPIKRLAMPEEIADCVLFLCSESSSYMNGSNLVVDGGWTSI